MFSGICNYDLTLHLCVRGKGGREEKQILQTNEKKEQKGMKDDKTDKCKKKTDLSNLL